jgi:uncharacterized protein YndB with AHSA1/START domain
LEIALGEEHVFVEMGETIRGIKRYGRYVEDRHVQNRWKYSSCTGRERDGVTFKYSGHIGEVLIRMVAQRGTSGIGRRAARSVPSKPGSTKSTEPSAGGVVMAETSIITEPGKQEIITTREFDAPRDLVFRAWTDPELIARWWGPASFTALVFRVDLREGGRYLFGMRLPDGRDFWSTGVYREIVAGERLVFTDSFADAEGNVVPASAYGMSGDWPLELLVTVMFEEHDGGTKMTLRHEGIPAGESLDMTEAGWNESLDKLGVVLKELSKG